MEADEEAARTLREHAERLASQSVEAACTGSFWDERFGERGRHYIHSDARHHVDHLATALSFGRTSIMAGYAHWLQQVLTVRGMCSRHIAEHFMALEAAILADGLPHANAASPYLRAGVDALRHDSDPARALEDAAESLADAALQGIASGHPTWFENDGTSRRSRVRADLLYLLSYLADAAALDRPDIFSDYLAWVAEYFRRHRRKAAYARVLITALEEALDRLTIDGRDAARGILAGGLDRTGQDPTRG